MSELIIRGGTIVTVNDDWHVLGGDVACRDGELVQVGGDYTPVGSDYQIIDAEGCIVMPGLVQSHVHMCQTLARGRADDMSLLDWLAKVVWPYEGALRPDEMRACARLAATELLLGGTTAILDMGTVHHTDVLFEVAAEAGLRATIGKAMMDEPDPRIPPGLRESTDASLAESRRLCEQWHGAEADRLRYAFAPRFAVSCTDRLMRETAGMARELGARLHTHASENTGEIAEVEKRSRMRNVLYLHDCGFSGDDVTLAHCVWLDDAERKVLADTGTHVAHCPSSNLKLASGMAEVPELMALGIKVSLGADGAPCNNNLDIFTEMRLAALIHKPRCGPRAMAAPLVVRMATMGGAAALGRAGEIGSLEVGKLADVTVVDTRAPHVVPTTDPHSALVYACRAGDVRHVVVGGQLVVHERELLTLQRDHVVDAAAAASHSIFDRL